MDEENKVEAEVEAEEQEADSSEMKSWLQDNFRIIVSIIIVVAIAGGIYSYSKRTQPTVEKLAEKETQLIDQSKNVEVQGSKTGETKKAEVSSAATSQETETSFVEKAGRGDGSTKLARRALANYLEKNPDSSLTAEHKIYIEDYLRKNVGFKGGVHIGTSIEFSKDLVKQAVEKSKTLNDRQLKNLHKYAVRVPSLS
jgi:hypothetical protein